MDRAHIISAPITEFTEPKLGILILTSNRVGTFDEAFKSRIQLNVRYQSLDESQRHKIRSNFIRRLEGIEAKRLLLRTPAPSTATSSVTDSGQTPYTPSILTTDTTSTLSLLSPPRTQQQTHEYCPKFGPEQRRQQLRSKRSGDLAGAARVGGDTSEWAGDP